MPAYSFVAALLLATKQGERKWCTIILLSRCLSHILHGGQHSDVAAPEAFLALTLLVDEQKGDRDVLGQIFRDDVSAELLWCTIKEEKTIKVPRSTRFKA